MKKVLFISAVGIMGLLSSCSKETNSVAPQTQTQTSHYDKRNMDEIIKLADPQLYRKIHMSKEKLVLEFTNGSWVTDPVSNKRKCVTSNDICSIKIVSAEGIYTDSTFVISGHTYTYQNFTTLGDAVLIAVEPTTPVVYNIKKLVTDRNNTTQEVELTYETF